MTGARHLSPKDCEELPSRIREYLTLTEELHALTKKHAEIQGRLAHDLGEKKIAINWGGGKVIESDGRTKITVTETNIEIIL